MKNVSIKLGFKTALVFIALLVSAVWIIHLTIARPLAIPRFLYPAEAIIAEWSSTCSPSSPEWLSATLSDVIRHGGGLANQLAYIAPDGNLSHCENGWQDGLLQSEKVTASTRFRYASLTKVFTADAILELVNHGKIKLSSKLLDLLPPMGRLKDERVGDITIAHLLSHRSGFDRTIGMPDMLQLNKTPWCPGSLDQLAEKTLEYDPGSKASYSNLGYCLLGVVIERVSGMPYRDYMEQRYRLADRGVRFIDGPYLEDEVRYDFRNSSFLAEDYYKYWDFEALSSSAGLSGSAVQLAKLIQDGMNIRGPRSLTSREYVSGDCSSLEFRSCYGHALYKYQAQKEDLLLYMQEGHLPGASSLLVIDQHGGIFVWLGAGQPLRGVEAKTEIYQRLYQRLEESYASSQ